MLIQNNILSIGSTSQSLVIEMDIPLQPGRTNSMIYRFLEDALIEDYNKIPMGMKDNYPAFHKFKTQVEVHASVYPQSLKVYEEDVGKINQRFGVYDIEMYPEEVMERLRAVLTLAKSIGLIQLNQRYWKPYNDVLEPDEVTLDCFNFDTTHIEDSEFLQKLITFYGTELEQEYEGRMESVKRKEAVRRAKNAVSFYERYERYRKTGFDPRKIEEIFNITKQDQSLFDYWIAKIMPTGLIVSTFAKAGMGKTNFSSFLIQLILIMRPNWTIITNIPLIFSPWTGVMREYKIDNIIFVSTLSDLMEANANTVLQGRIPCILIDEFDAEYVGTESRSRKALVFKRYVYLERHWNNQGPLLIYHRFGDIPVELRNKAISSDVYEVAYYHNKLTHQRRRVLSNPDMWEGGPYGRRYLPIPITSLPYYNKAFSDFTIEEDLKDIMQGIRGTQQEAATQLLEALRAWRLRRNRQQNRQRRET